MDAPGDDLEHDRRGDLDIVHGSRYEAGIWRSAESQPFAGLSRHTRMSWMPPDYAFCHS